MAYDESKRGVKRKRELPLAEEEDVVVKLSRKLHHGLKEVKKASKKAKTFETQKLVKKLKDLRKNEKEEDIKTTELQLETLKHLDHERIAATALKSKLKKDHVLSNNADTQSAISQELPSTSQEVPPESSPHSVTVESRMLSSKVLAQEISAVVRALRTILGFKTNVIEKGEQDVKESSKAPTKVVAKSGSRAARKDRAEARARLAEADDVKVIDDLEQEEAGDSSQENETVEDDGWESGSVDMGSGNAKQDADDGWESGSMNGEEDHPTASGSEEDDSDIAIINNVGDSESDISPAPARPPKKTKPSKESNPNSKTKPQAGESTFLPSLAVGFTRGDSDASDWSDDDANIADGLLKKNRRGQRARKAIWEKKYGKNANHVKKQREESEASGRGGWGRGRGTGRGMAQGGAGRTASARPTAHAHDQRSSNSSERDTGRGMSRGVGVRGRGLSARGRGAFGETGSNAISVGARPERRLPEEKPLHPSWEAKRKQKEKQSAGIVPSQGTRLRFD